MSDSPSAFSVAHYVLLFIVSTLCTISVVWVLIAANNREAAIHDNILRTTKDRGKTCQRATADKITLIWQTDSASIPQKYRIMEENYANRVTEVRTSGMCKGEKFICKMGQIRSDCDPCAKNSAQKRAMFQHISDAIDENCKNK